MKTANIRINTIEDVKNFVTTVTKCNYDVDIVSGRYAIDAKSIMGIFSLDLSKPLELRVHSDDCDELLAELDKYIVKYSVILDNESRRALCTAAFCVLLGYCYRVSVFYLAHNCVLITRQHSYAASV